MTSMAVASLVVMFVFALLMKDSPRDVGLEPYGAAAPAAKAVLADPRTEVQIKELHTGEQGLRRRIELSLSVFFHKKTFGLLAASFMICGATSMGLVGTHLIPHSIDIGISQALVGVTLSTMGVMNVIGTLAAGWLTDRMDPRKLLCAVFSLRALSLFALPYVSELPGLLIFGTIFGAGWFATVPPVVSLASGDFGKHSIGSVYGLIFLAHQIGSFLATTAAGALRTESGNYQSAFLLGGAVSLVGAALSLGVPRPRPTSEHWGEMKVRSR